MSSRRIPDTSEHKIYGLIDPRSGELRYIGKTKSKLRDRYNGHLNPRRQDSTYRACWIRKLLRLGLKPEIVLVQECGVGWENAERFWIAYFRERGANLVNSCAGGYGLDTPSEAVREKLRVSHTGLVKSDVTREKLSKALVGRTLSLENKDGIGCSLAKTYLITLPSGEEVTTSRITQTAREKNWNANFLRDIARKGKSPARGTYAGWKCKVISERLGALDIRKRTKFGPAKNVKRSIKGRQNISDAASRWYEVSCPAGDILIVQGLTRFAKRFGLAESPLSNTARGSQESYNGWRARKLNQEGLTATHIDHALEKRIRSQVHGGVGKFYKLVGPNDEIMFSSNLSKTCRELGFPQSKMSQVSLGRISSHKGWRVEVISIQEMMKHVS